MGPGVAEDASGNQVRLAGNNSGFKRGCGGVDGTKEVWGTETGERVGQEG